MLSTVALSNTIWFALVDLAGTIIISDIDLLEEKNFFVQREVNST